MRRHFWVLLVLVLFIPAVAVAKGSHRSGGSHSRANFSSKSTYRSRSYTPRTRSSYSSSSRRTYSSHPRSTRTYNPRTHSSYGSTRNSHGRIQRSAAAKDAFKRQHPCPSTGRSTGACPGYVIDHINALACGGLDSPSNMQWQTVVAGKAKDKWERKGCK